MKYFVKSIKLNLGIFGGGGDFCLTNFLYDLSRMDYRILIFAFLLVAKASGLNFFHRVKGNFPA